MVVGERYPFGTHAVALVGNHLPRRCGIATFTTDLLKAMSDESSDVRCWAVAMNDTPEGYAYPPEVRFEVNWKNLADYRMAADFLNMNQVDVVCLQHEFGIFGGDCGGHVLELARHLRMPLVTTLHTVLEEPSDAQRAVLLEIAKFSERLVVMSMKAREMMQEIYGVAAEKIALIPHGIPDVPFVDPNFYKDQFGVEGKKVILTFGLLSPGKGIEHMIEAMPRIIEAFPDAVYIVLGATHPNVKREQGEAYRHSLQRKARELGVEQHIVFHNRFVELTELCEFLGAADLYVTPYLAKEQIVSGTLAYALGAGKAIVSTPYWYAEEILADGRGVIVPFRDSDALAEAVISLFRNETERHAMRKRAYTYSREMTWTQVARKYLQLFVEVKHERERRPRRTFRTRTLEAVPLELPQLKLDHLKRMTDGVGMLQHANFIVPNRFHGYCTDDNARALIATVTAMGQLESDEELLDLACRYLSFLDYAFDDGAGRFHNFMGYDRRWLDEVGSEDSHGRAAWALGQAVALSHEQALTGVAVNLLHKVLPPMLDFSAPRAWAFGVLGASAYLSRIPGDSEVRRIRERLAARLFELYKSRATDDWPWMEDVVTYANGKISQALIAAGVDLSREDMVEAGLRSLRWLLEIQTDPRGHLVPIGNRGWYRRGGEKARFDQQPIEAQNLIQACTEAYEATKEEKWVEEARRCFEWFLGKNDLGVPLYDYKSGGCCDGLCADGLNMNQGAEATLAWLLSLLSMHAIEESEARETVSQAVEVTS